MEFFVEVFLALVVLGYLLYVYGTRNLDYWTKRGVVGPKPYPFVGTSFDFIVASATVTEILRGWYNFAPKEPYVGLLVGSKPSLFLRSPELIKTVLTKDFDFFPDRPMSYHEKYDPLSINLVNIEGMRWKTLRSKLTPTFSSGRIKNMVPLMAKCSKELEKHLDRVASKGGAVEMREILKRYTTDIIGSCAFGVDCNALKDPNAEFYRQAHKMFELNWRNKIRNTVMMAFRKKAFLHWLTNDRDATKFFIGIVKETIKHRKENKTKRNDFMELMIEIKEKGKLVDDKVDTILDAFLKIPVSTSSEEFNFTENLMTAQAAIFFGAGFETSSTTMAFCISEVAQHPEIQRRIQDELDRVLKKHNGITYEALSEMHYLDKVVSETLRKHPPVVRTARVVSRPYKVPGSEMVLEPGTWVVIPVDALQHDPTYFPDPERFDPERFSAEAVAARPAFTYLPFGEGPRICIGMRFGLLQTKAGLATVMSKYRLKPSPLSKYPIEYDRATFVSCSVDGCHVVLEKRDIS